MEVRGTSDPGTGSVRGPVGEDCREAGEWNERRLERHGKTH